MMGTIIFGEKDGFVFFVWESSLSDRELPHVRVARGKPSGKNLLYKSVNNQWVRDDMTSNLRVSADEYETIHMWLHENGRNAVEKYREAKQHIPPYSGAVRRMNLN